MRAQGMWIPWDIQFAMYLRTSQQAAAVLSQSAYNYTQPP